MGAWRSVARLEANVGQAEFFLDGQQIGGMSLGNARDGSPSCAASISVQQYVSSTSRDHSAWVTVSDQQTMPWLAAAWRPDSRPRG